LEHRLFLALEERATSTGSEAAPPRPFSAGRHSNLPSISPNDLSARKAAPDKGDVPTLLVNRQNLEEDKKPIAVGVFHFFQIDVARDGFMLFSIRPFKIGLGLAGVDVEIHIPKVDYGILLVRHHVDLKRAVPLAIVELELNVVVVFALVRCLIDKAVSGLEVTAVKEVLPRV
jgi:hypothetical protein